MSTASRPLPGPAIAPRRSASVRRPSPVGAALRSVVDLSQADVLGLRRGADVGRRPRARRRTSTGGAHLARALAAFTGFAAATVLEDAAADVTPVLALAGPDTLVVADGHHVDSIRGACATTGAALVVTPHHSVDAVHAALSSRSQARALVMVPALTETVGRRAPLAELHRVCRQHGALLVVSETHSLSLLGTRGSGLAAETGLVHADDVLVTASLAPTLGVHCGAALGAERVVAALSAHTSLRGRHVVSPEECEHAIAALELLHDGGQHGAQALRRAKDLREAVVSARYVAARPEGACVTVLFGSALRARGALAAWEHHGVRAHLPATTLADDGLHRVCLRAHADLSAADIAHVRRRLAAASAVAR